MKTLKKQNETLKAWNGTEINFIWKSQFGFSSQSVLELEPGYDSKNFKG